MKCILLLGSLLLSMASSPVWAQIALPDTPVWSQDDQSPVDPGAETHFTRTKGFGVFHGNYCGVGDNGAGLPPIDALDEACRHHDSCTPEGGIPTCACNARFAAETRAVVNRRAIDDDLRALAGLVAASIAFILCRP